ncbi:MAG: SDR family oxidoreductase [Acidobacteriota bacterium]
MGDDSKWVVITGVTRGLGRALARAFADEGWRVAGCGRSEDALSSLTEELGETHRFAALDVSDTAAVAAWGEEVMAAHGAPHLLINNAALINSNAPLWEVPAEEIDRLFAVNLAGVCHVIRAWVPAMVARRRGVIVNLSSGWGRSTAPEVAPYCASKWGIEGLSRSLAQELPAGMAAVPLNPGIIHTEMLSEAFGAGAASYPKPGEWVKRAMPLLLGLGPEHNGRPMTVPGS